MFDIGVNLTSSQFSRDRDEVVSRARAAGVRFVRDRVVALERGGDQIAAAVLEAYRNGDL